MVIQTSKIYLSRSHTTIAWPARKNSTDKCSEKRMVVKNYRCSNILFSSSHFSALICWQQFNVDKNKFGFLGDFQFTMIQMGHCNWNYNRILMLLLWLLFIVRVSFLMLMLAFLFGFFYTFSLCVRCELWGCCCSWFFFSFFFCNYIPSSSVRTTIGYDLGPSPILVPANTHIL